MDLYKFQAEMLYSPDHADKRYFVLFHIFQLLYELGKTFGSCLLLVFITKDYKS